MLDQLAAFFHGHSYATCPGPKCPSGEGRVGAARPIKTPSPPRLTSSVWCPLSRVRSWWCPSGRRRGPEGRRGAQGPLSWQAAQDCPECDRRSPIYPAEMCVCRCSALGRTPTLASQSRALCNGNRPVRGRLRVLCWGTRKLHLEARQRVVHVTAGRVRRRSALGSRQRRPDE